MSIVAFFPQPLGNPSSLPEAPKTREFPPQQNAQTNNIPRAHVNSRTPALQRLTYLSYRPRTEQAHATRSQRFGRGAPATLQATVLVLQAAEQPSSACCRKLRKPSACSRAKGQAELLEGNPQGGLREKEARQPEKPPACKLQQLVQLDEQPGAPSLVQGCRRERLGPQAPAEDARAANRERFKLLAPPRGRGEVQIEAAASRGSCAAPAASRRTALPLRTAESDAAAEQRGRPSDVHLPRRRVAPSEAV